tara:strand:+ start:842 stop:1039 length:198 start_codon:yes stop_codon:yes gene_type:complete
MKKADKIIEQQRLLKKELEKIQKKCNHNSKTIKFNNDENRYMWTCDECQSSLSYPSPNEIEDYLK